MATRVTSPSDQNRTAVTLLGAVGAAPRSSSTATSEHPATKPNLLRYCAVLR